MKTSKKIKLTNKARLNTYKKALKIMLEDTSEFLCLALYRALSSDNQKLLDDDYNKIDSDDFLIHFPEVFSQKPKTLVTNNVWFPIHSPKRAITLQKAIKKLEKK